MPFTAKIIEVKITLANNLYPSGGNTKVIKGLPTLVEIGQAGLPSRDSARVKIYGLKQEDMEVLTFLNFKNLFVNPNLIEIYAGDKENGMSLMFAGEIANAFPEYNNAPDVYLDIEALAGYYPGFISDPPYSFNGNIPASTILSDLANRIDYTFVNEGEDLDINNPYLVGSPIQKIMTLTQSYGLDVTIANRVIKMKNKNNRNLVVSLSAESSMVGYPSFTNNGIRVRSELIPNIELRDTFKVTSIVPKASGEWQVVSIRHSFGTDIVDAPWFTTLEGSYLEK